MADPVSSAQGMGTAVVTPAGGPSFQRHYVTGPGLEAGQPGGRGRPGGRRQSRLGPKSRVTKLVVSLKSGVIRHGREEAPRNEALPSRPFQFRNQLSILAFPPVPRPGHSPMTVVFSL